MSINISKIQNEEYRKLAESIDKEKEGRQGYNNGYLDSSEVSIFCAKVNEKLSEDKKIDTFLELAEFLGFKKKDNVKANTRQDYNLVNNLPKQADKVTADNVVYLLTEYKNKNGKYCETQVILDKLLEKAAELKITLEDKDKNVATLVSKIKEATDNTYFVEELNEEGVDKVVHMGDAELAVSEIHYNDGRVVLIEHGRKTNGTVNLLVEPSKESSKVIAPRNINEEALPINTDLPSDASNNAKSIAKALVENKAKLMSFLKIDNATYDKYVSFTLALIERETDFGKGCVLYDEKSDKFEIDKMKYALQEFIADDFEIESYALEQNIHLPSLIRGYKNLSKDPVSFGMSGIKYDSIVASARKDNKEAKVYRDILKGYNTFEINSAEDLYNPEKCAIATLIYAVKSVEILENLCENDSKHYRTKTEYSDLESRLQAHSDIPTEFEVVANMWNRGPSFILDGMLDKSWEHTRTVCDNMKKYIVY